MKSKRAFAAIAAVALPLLLAPALFLMVAPTHDLSSGLANKLEYAVKLVTAAAVLGMLGTAVLGRFLALGRRIPAAVLIAFATLPWWAGLAGVYLDGIRMLGAVGIVGPGGRTFFVASGIWELLSSNVLGSWAAASLSCAVALQFGLSAWASGAARRVTGAVVGLPALGALVLFALAAQHSGRFGAFLVVPALVFIASAIGGAYAGPVPEGGSSPSPLGAPVAGALAFIAGASTLHGVVAGKAYGAVFSVGTDGGSVAPVISSFASAASAWRWAVALAVVCFIVACAWALIRSKLSWVGAAASLVLVAGVVAADRAISLYFFDQAARVAEGNSPELEGMQLPDVLKPGRTAPRVVLRPGVISIGDRLFPLAAIEGGDARRMLLDALAEELGRDEDHPFDEPASLEMAVDARIPAAVVRSTIDASWEAGARAIRFVGRIRTDGNAGAIPRELRLLEIILQSAGVADARLGPPPGADGEKIVEIADGMTAEQIVGEVSRLSKAGYHPVLPVSASQAEAAQTGE